MFTWIKILFSEKTFLKSWINGYYNYTLKTLHATLSCLNAKLGKNASKFGWGARDGRVMKFDRMMVKQLRREFVYGAEKVWSIWRDVCVQHKEPAATDLHEYFEREMTREIWKSCESCWGLRKAWRGVTDGVTGKEERDWWVYWRIVHQGSSSPTSID